MKQILASVFALVFSFGLFIEDAEAARRLGGGGNVGAQRSITSTPRQATPPTQQQAAPATAGKAAPAAPAAVAPAGNRWLGPLAGLAAGLGLGYLFSQGGMGGLMSALLMGLVAVVVVVMLMRVFGRRAPQQPMQYAGMGQQPVAVPPSAPSAPTPLETPRAADPAPAFGSAAPVAAAPVAAVNVPAGFDVEGFLKQGKRNFLMLQQANDAGDVALIKDVTTEEMFEALRPQLNERVASGDSLDVSNLEASLLEVTTEGEYHWASIRFHGMMREGAGAAPAPFEEVWNLRKPVAGNSGWLLAGIQQVS